ncbi:PLD nuclease N-terminal domain-containing protein [Actinotalea fermentans]|uniref:Cardiolipin synthase N-terminal domain-containing protein n=1 Tax=Actinotalea fermentans TaxID=43671 RepID=A0A511Z0I2_9CELL|nr:PLD nuclease N-terminal domain-containing protein [Actinotalea fermentans]GEN80943.1 hypothetical protein AFE02nite_26770 [Actinotalea fermentans]
MLRALVYVVPIALAIFALIDLSRSLPEERAGLRRTLWVAIIVLLPVLGPIVWIAVSRNSRAGSAPARPRPLPPMAPGRGPLRPPTRRPGPVAPDDDPEFLWRLEQERRRAAGEPPSEDQPPA